MATLPKTGIITYEEWVNMPVSEGREEVVNGEIRPMPPARYTHAFVVQKLVAAFIRQLDDADYNIFSGSFGVIIRKTPLTSRTPDVAIFERASLVETDGYLHSPPQLAIEVLSPSESRSETAEKVADYESIGVPEVWIVSPQGSTVEVLLLEQGRLCRSAILADGILTPRELPQVQVDISRIWPD
jgi:Uma2 family endonuclease